MKQQAAGAQTAAAEAHAQSEVGQEALTGAVAVLAEARRRAEETSVTASALSGKSNEIKRIYASIQFSV